MSGPVLIMAGGTGGHIFPGLAVAQALRARGVPVAWLGNPAGMEGQVVPPTGIPMEYVSIGGLRGKGLATKLLAPIRICSTIAQCLGIIRRLRPRAVLGMGGYVAGPGGVAAWLSRRPLVIHEQNAVAGMTNKILSRFATDILEAFPASFPAPSRARPIGNPVRLEISELEEPATRMAGRSGRLRLLVFGGSQGALKLNETVPAALALMPTAARPEVLHQAGGATLDIARAAYTEAGVEAEITPFIDDMAAAYGWADIAICRSGALTVSELAAAGLGSVLVPFPAAVDDHQTRNADYLVDAGAATLIQETDLDTRGLAARLEAFAADREQLVKMASAARGQARPAALDELATTCLEAARNGAGA
jgi:UDP-N-acetylglucosamine--N-acetylmuramyl-(pentapeptide) pyrophosphoryl-undecaprenol N-acetylglucosamine transferase